VIVYGGAGKAARNWRVVRGDCPRTASVENDEDVAGPVRQTVAVFRTHEYAPRVLIAIRTFARLGNWTLHELERRGLMMYGQMTAGS